MEHPSFTAEEKRIVARVLFREPKKKVTLFIYFVSILPSMLFAGYSVWVQDWRAGLLAYVALLVMVVLYANDAQNTAYPLYSAIKKYEAVVGALQRTEKLDT